MRNSLCFIALVALSTACDDVILDRPVTRVTITASQRGSNFLFAGLPVHFGIDYSEEPKLSGWLYGDGTSSDGTIADHIFDFPGSYHVSALLENRKFSADTVLVISPRLKLIGSKGTSENGKYIFENPGSGYSVIHTLNSGTSVDDWMFLTTSATFDSLRSKKLAFDWYANVFDAFVNSEGNIIILVDGHLREMNRNGLLLRDVYAGSPWTPIQILEVENGYLLGGYHFDGTLRVGHFNDNLEKVSEVQVDFLRNGFSMSEFCLESETVIRLHYYQSGGMENPSRMFVMADLEGNVLFEKAYSAELAPYKSFRLSSGYLLLGGRSFNGSGEFVFSKVSDSGDVLWSATSPVQSDYPGYVHGGRMAVIEDGSFVFIFFDNQKGMKINTTSGEVVWLKRFGASQDTFNAATKNSAGNFVLLGAHQFDYINFEYTPEYNKRDLMLLEIDGDGNIVD